MEDLDIRELTSGYRERVRRLALFEPLYELARKRIEVSKENNIDMMGLGLLSLLFFFEQKLMRQSKTGVQQLALFLKKSTDKIYTLSGERYEELARMIIQTFRPTHGKKRRYDYFDWELGEDQWIEYSILKANNFDMATNTQYYTLDEDGLELVFATKEFYSEFQLSINQLILRKQLEKGEFKGALRQINEMRIDVETLQERLFKLQHEIQRSIVSEETLERYKQLLEDIYRRLEREDEEFKELRNFVKETKERLYSQDVHQKERETYGYVIKINHQLEEVHYEHSHLLKQTMTLQNTTLITAQESLYYVGIQSFNFSQDMVSPIISTPLPLEAMKGILHPFLRIEENQYWSPLTIFADQNILEDRQERAEYHFLTVVDDESGDAYKMWRAQKYYELMAIFIQAYEVGRGQCLSQLMDYLEEKGLSHLYEERSFYDFWIILHQRSPIIQGGLQDKGVEGENQTILGEAFSLLQGRTLQVIEGPSIIHKVERYSIQEMFMEMEEEADELS